MIEECKNCIYFRIDDDTGEGFCKQTYCDTSGESDACDDFVSICDY